MTDTAAKIAELSPKKRALLLERLRAKRAEEAKAAAEAAPAASDAATAPGAAARPAAPSAAADGSAAGRLGRIEPLPRAGGAEELFPVSFSQLREWILDRLEPGTSAYNVPMAVALEGALDAPALARAVRALVARHESLRTGFRGTAAAAGGSSAASAPGRELYSGEPVQVVARSVPAQLPVVDLSDLPAARRADEARRRARRLARFSFDLGRPPLLRTVLVRLGESDHRLLLVMHHIVSDGWSMGVLFRDLGELYRAAADAADAAALPALPIQYGDFAAWQRRTLRGETLERLVGYWREELGDSAGVLELPTDRPRPAERGGAAAAAVGFRVPPATAAALGRRARERGRGASLFMVLLAGLAVLLHRLTGEDDVNVGTYIANRNRAETAELIGFFVNSLVLRTRLGGDPTLEELVGRLRRTTLGAYEHQDLPFERLLEVLQPKRDPSRTPLFQVLFVLQNTPRPELELPGLKLSGTSAEGERANYDLAFFLAESPEDGEAGGGIAGTIEYDPRLFDRTTVRRFARAYGAALEALAGAPGDRLSTIGLLAPAEHHQLTREWPTAPEVPEASENEVPDASETPFTEALTEVPDASETSFAEVPEASEMPRSRALAEVPEASGAATVVGLFAARAAAAPDRVAFETADGRSLSYGALSRRVAALVRGLERRGVGPGDTVGVLVGGPDRAVAAFLAVAAAGAAYLPIDPEYPAERIAFLAADAGVRLLVATGGARPAAGAGGGAATVDVDELEREGAAGADRLVSRADPDGLAYVLYTSGSTGRPKGVEVGHRGLAAYARTAREGYRLAPADRVLQFAALSFDASAEEIYPTLAAGATLVFRDPAAPPAPSELLALVERRRVTVLDLPTAYWHGLVQSVAAASEASGTSRKPFPEASGTSGRGAPEASGTSSPEASGTSEGPATTGVRAVPEASGTSFSEASGTSGAGVPEGLRLVILGGEAARGDAVAAWRRSAGGDGRSRLVNTYGPTEATIVCSWADLVGDGPAASPDVVPIGRAVPGARLLVLDRHLRPVPLGAVGELAIGGVGLARAYRGRPGLTAERFVPDPYSATLGARLYRSGDLVRARADGSLVFAGRIDHQVKVRGFRIEPGEVEAALAAVPGVAAAAVGVEESAPGVRRLVAWVVSEDPEAPPAAADLRRHLAERLPPHMLPSAYVPLPELPLTAHGKLDRRRLPAPGADRPEVATAYAAPRTPEERALAAVWREVLGVERPGIHDNFFDLGGDSLLLLQVYERLAAGALPSGATAASAVTVLDLFRYPTIEALAARLAPRSEERTEARKVDDRLARQREAIARRRTRGAAAARPGGRPTRPARPARPTRPADPRSDGGDRS